ncbi:acyl-CoA N-acyltransferase [Gilbertella persicaria]|uniref:acyl-CoA N-acyltransferase n=1 Tax=Gilbertella persicaria TaxID=101096 RepID=UPI002220EDAA|nr:acyl-CoA N-acyltransferase [Gilbertella persicaria]KAI8082645.1 acyl-CoA N-acyltransferase [Gilbertella persicaria]
MVIIKQVTFETIDQQELLQLLELLKQLSSSFTKEAVEQALLSRQNHILVAISQEQVVGTTTMAYLHCLTGTRVHIEDVVVDMNHRGQGIAQLLIGEAILRAKKIKAKSIDLTSRPDREAANRLYRKLGFVQRETNVYRYQS